MLHGFAERYPVRVLVWPVRVQGETSAKEVAAAIRGFNALPGDGRLPRPDVLIVARGGGSLEDLWGFNEEIVVRAAAESAIPLVSAVGHETDWTLIDLAADARAPTPTKAAEWAVPKHTELVETIADYGLRLRKVIRRAVEAARTHLRRPRARSRLEICWRCRVSASTRSSAASCVASPQHAGPRAQAGSNRIALPARLVVQLVQRDRQSWIACNAGTGGARALDIGAPDTFRAAGRTSDTTSWGGGPLCAIGSIHCRDACDRSWRGA